MSIWGASLGAVAGVVIGGPLGALIGAALGHVAVDRPLNARARVHDPQKRQAIFSVAVIALAAKMASADGSNDPREKSAFDRLFHVAPDERENVARFWKLAQATPAGFEAYARQIASLFKDAPTILEDVVGALCAIAEADGHASEAEQAFLAKVMAVFNFSPGAMARFEARLSGDSTRDPWAVLGVSHDASEADIRAAYRTLVKQHHPDIIIAKGLPEEFRHISEARMATVNAAYEKLVRKQVSA
jgi:DnaJ like chaperone protein